MVGIDVADIGRVRGVLTRYPSAEERLFTKAERAYCRSFADPIAHFAATFAAKEAVVKALQLGPILAWARRIELVHDRSGVPTARVTTRTSQQNVVVSISHDADLAVAVALCPSVTNPASKSSRKASHWITDSPIPNSNLKRFLGQSHPEKDILRADRILVPAAECACGSDFP